MSYLRGKYYVYTGDDGVHLWVGSDAFEGTTWSEERYVDRCMGAVIPEEVFDALVVMRYAELQEEKLVEKVEKKTIKKYSGNFGSYALLRKHKIKTEL